MLKVHKLFDSNKLSNSIITIGNYDGVHLGHKHIIDKMLELSRDTNYPTVLLSFNPHTSEVLSSKKTTLLTTLENKKKLLEKIGLLYFCTVNFNKEISKMHADEFMNLLIKKYNPKSIFLGYDNKFGYKKSGSFKYLSNNKNYKGIDIIECKEFKKNNIPIKSSLIKKCISNGLITEANDYLGYNYIISGRVTKGEQLGSKIGFPTANIEKNVNKQLIPSNGVYSVNLIHNEVSYNAICNIGSKPTISNNLPITIEVHLIGVDKIDLYNSIVNVEFKFKIRDEICFETVEGLKNQISNDIKFLLEGEK